MNEYQYNIEIKNLIENNIAIYNGKSFTKYIANKYKKALTVYVIRNFKDKSKEEKEDFYKQWEKRIDKQIVDYNNF